MFVKRRDPSSSQFDKNSLNNCQRWFLCRSRKGARSLVRRCHTRTHAPSYVESPTYTVQHTSGTVSFLDRMWIMRYLKPRPAVWSVAHLFDFSPFEQIFDSRHRETVERLAGLPYRACVSDTKS